MNVFNIQRAFEDKKKRNWDRLYWLIDLHHVVIEGRYNRFNRGARIYPGCIQVFQWFSKREDMIPILWTSSYNDSINDVLEKLLIYGIRFKYINENPEVDSDKLCDFSKKLYFNILLDDKAGFEGEKDWSLVKEELMKIGEWE